MYLYYRAKRCTPSGPTTPNQAKPATAPPNTANAGGSLKLWQATNAQAAMTPQKGSDVSGPEPDAFSLTDL